MNCWILLDNRSFEIECKCLKDMVGTRRLELLTSTVSR